MSAHANLEALVFSALRTPRLARPVLSARAALPSLAPLLLWCAACGEGKGAADPAERAKMASDLVQCRNEQSALKDQVADLTAQLARLKAATDRTVHTEAVDVKAGREERHVEGNLAEDAMTRVIRANARTLTVCYEKGLKRNPNLQTLSAVRVHFFIRNTGRVERIGIAPHVESEMESCMSAAIGKWRFPEFQGDPVEVETPINLVAH